MGYSVRSQEDVERRRQRVEELEATVDQQDSELDQRQSRIEDLNSSIQEKESRIAELETEKATADQRVTELQADVERLRREKVSELYDVGYSQFQTGQSDFAKAETSESNGDYDIAEAQYALASAHFGSAEQSMDRAATVAGDAGFDATRLLVEESASTVESYESAALDYANESLYRVRGDTATADSFESDGDDALISAQSGTVHQPADVDSQLGL